MINYFTCNRCGKFISYKDVDARTYTNYGSYPDTEPPDEEFICGNCWNGLSDERKSYYEESEYIWIHATRLFNNDQHYGDVIE